MSHALAHDDEVGGLQRSVADNTSDVEVRRELLQCALEAFSALLETLPGAFCQSPGLADMFGRGCDLPAPDVNQIAVIEDDEITIRMGSLQRRHLSGGGDPESMPGISPAG